MSTTQKSLMSLVKAALAEGMNTSKAQWVVELDSKILSVREQDSRTSLLVYREAGVETGWGGRLKRQQADDRE